MAQELTEDHIRTSSRDYTYQRTLRYQLEALTYPPLCATSIQVDCILRDLGLTNSLHARNSTSSFDDKRRAPPK